MTTQPRSFAPGSTVLLSFALLAATAACSGVRLEPRPPASLAPALTTQGETVYFGSVFPFENGDAPITSQPTFVYERRVDGRDQALVSSTHITRDQAGAIVLADSATHSAGYDLRDYTLHTNQQGQRGSVHVDKDQVSFRLIDGGEERTATEKASGAVVVGPTLVGYIYRHLGALRAREVIPVRLAVLDRLETIGFELQATEAPAGQTRIEMKASSFLMATLIAPIHFTFESATGNLVRIEGRMPSKIQRGDRLHDLDARVEYRYVAAAYR